MGTSAPGDDEAEPSGSRAIRVVIAEDEGIIRMDLRELLEEEGYDLVGECGNGAEAIDLVAALHPDVAILDVKMPVMDGIAAARVLIDERACAVVLLTAFSQRALIEEARDVGVMSYVVKPFERSDLVPAIEMAVGRFVEVTALHGRVDDLAAKLELRKLLDRAKGRLIDRDGLSETEAFSALQKLAMNSRRSMEAVCEEVLAESF